MSAPSPVNGVKMPKPSPIACIECRKHHLKCNAGKPSCARCAKAQLPCDYLPSRRGGRRNVHKKRPNQQTRETLERVDPAFIMPLDASHPYLTESDIARIQRASENRPTKSPIHNLLDPCLLELPDTALQELQEFPFDNSIPPLPGRASEGNSNWLGQSPSAIPESHGCLPSPSNGSPIEEQSVRVFYDRFYPAHPFLVPVRAYEDRQYPEFLQRIVRFIGCHYHSSPAPDGCTRESITAELDLINERPSSCLVQARLLWSLFLYFQARQAEARTCLSRAIDTAIHLGMHQREFAALFSQSHTIEAESLRRTWWELFIAEALMQIPRGEEALFRCGDVPYDVDLPCEESVYAVCDPIPQSLTITSFDKRIFLDAESRFSSFTYRIEAVRILMRIVSLNNSSEQHPDNLQAVQNALVGWKSHLPSNKVDTVDMYGEEDEMLFQAHSIIHFAEMLLHLPRSTLRPAFPGTNVVSCPAVPPRLPATFTSRVHDVKAIEASKQLSNLLSIAPRTRQHTPFSICWSLMCGVVQLATSKCHSQNCLDHHLNRVVLVLGCLKVLGNTWALARNAQSHLKRISAETFCPWMDTYSSRRRNTYSAGSDMSRYASDNPVGISATIDEDVQGSDSSIPEIISTYFEPVCSDSFLPSRIAGID